MPVSPTKSGRCPQPTISSLKEKFKVCRGELLALLSTKQVTDETSSLELVQRTRNLLKVAWLSCESAYDQLSSLLRKEGITQEEHNLSGIFSTLRTDTKIFVQSLKRRRLELGEDLASRSAFSSMCADSVLTSRERLELEQKLQITKTKMEAEKKIKRLETQQKLLGIRSNKEKLEQEEKALVESEKLEEEKIIVKGVEEIGIIEAQLGITSEPRDSIMGDILSECEPEPNRTAEWVFSSAPYSRLSQVRETAHAEPLGNIITQPHKNTGGEGEPITARSSALNLINCSVAGVRVQPGDSTNVVWSSSLNPSAKPYQPIPLNTNINHCGNFDASTRYLALAELKRVPSKPFQGEPPLFQGWIGSLKHRMEPLQLSGLDKIDILEAHTLGRAREVVDTFKIANLADPNAAFSIILENLTKRFGRAEEVALVLQRRLTTFPDIKGLPSDPCVAAKLRQLGDLCTIVKANNNTIDDLQTLNHASGLQNLRNKLPDFLDNKWRQLKGEHTLKYGTHPKFEVFCEFLVSKADILCADASRPSEDLSWERENNMLSLQTTSSTAAASNFGCPLHRTNNHAITSCTAYAEMSTRNKLLLVNSFELCYRCLGHHLATICDKLVTCSLCSSTNHVTLLHREKTKSQSADSRAAHWNKKPATRQSFRTSLYDEDNTISCGKTVLVDVRAPGVSGKIYRTYAIIDEQSNQSFGTSQLFDYLGVDSKLHDYSITTLNDTKSRHVGRVVDGLVIRGVTEEREYSLPSLYENNNIPDTKYEATTPNMLKAHPSLQYLSDKFPPIDETAATTLLIGRDAVDLMVTKVIENTSPVVHHTVLGWAIVGSLSMTGSRSNSFMALRSELLSEHFSARKIFPQKPWSVFDRFRDDEMIGFSVEDKRFISIMENNVCVNEKGNIQMPLPFRKENQILPDNSRAVFGRMKGTLSRLSLDKGKLEKCVSSMQFSISAGHVEEVPQGELSGQPGKIWYIPVFPVTQPKSGKVRLVFDSAASYHGTSLNGVLLSGPDQNNRLQGTLLRFRERPIAFVGDVEAMFHSFYVEPYHRDFLRFFWFANNDPTGELVQYRSNVHIFGNTSSPAVAIFGLRKAAELYSEQHGDNQKCFYLAKRFIQRNFYVDDALGCANSVDDAVGILKEVVKILSSFNIRLHKILAQDAAVLNAFPCSEHAKNAELILKDDITFRTLGVAWEVEIDCFSIRLNLPDRPYTKRGILAVINSVFDPLGIVSPVVLGGRLIQRAILSNESSDSPSNITDWDDLLPDLYYKSWETWLRSLQKLDSLRVERSFVPRHFVGTVQQSLHIFCDASKEAIGYVIYVRSCDEVGAVHVTFVVGDSKLAPRGAASIPRLELCAAVEAVLSAQRVQEELDTKPHAVHYYTDSKVVLGYISNVRKRFTVYVTRRVGIIRHATEHDQWHYVSSENNPADIATRPVGAQVLKASDWVSGP